MAVLCSYVVGSFKNWSFEILKLSPVLWKSSIFIITLGNIRSLQCLAIYFFVSISRSIQLKTVGPCALSCAVRLLKYFFSVCHYGNGVTLMTEPRLCYLRLVCWNRKAAVYHTKHNIDILRKLWSYTDATSFSNLPYIRRRINYRSCKYVFMQCSFGYYLYHIRYHTVCIQTER